MDGEQAKDQLIEEMRENARLRSKVAELQDAAWRRDPGWLAKEADRISARLSGHPGLSAVDLYRLVHAVLEEEANP
jgi:hypothetical protein